MTSRDVLEDVIDYWDHQIGSENVIKRDISDDVAASTGLEEVTVIRGVRRAGKTFLLYWLKRSQGGLYINFEDERLNDMSPADLDKVLEIATSRGTRMLYFDEVQVLPGWEKFAHRTLRRAKIFVTGSNSRMLASTYSKALVGRTKSFDIYPLSYGEFLNFKGTGPSPGSVLEYMRTGGFPRIVMTDDLSLAKEYFERVIYRDVPANSSITDVDALKAIAIYLLSNAGKEFSYRSLTTISALKHEETIKNYVQALRDAFLLDVVPRYHPSLRVQQAYGKKVYGVDPAFIALGRRKDLDLGRSLENIVFLHLKRRTEDLFYAKNAHELDFIICQGLRPMKAVSVCIDAQDQATIKREVSQVDYFKARLNVPIELVSLDPFPVPERIDQRLAHRFLLE